MRLLLDTHVLLWWLAKDSLLSGSAYEWIADGQHEIYVSAASAWEISIKSALGKLRVPDDLPAAIARDRFRALDISIAHAAAAGALPRHHNDPFDHMLIAQAKLENLMLLTADRRLSVYGEMVRVV